MMHGIDVNFRYSRLIAKVSCVNIGIKIRGTGRAMQRDSQ